MKKVKMALFATSILGTLAIAHQVAAEQQYTPLVISHYKEYDGTFDIETSQQPTNQVIQKIDVAIWSEENGQDDLKWYSSTNDGKDPLKVHFNVINHDSKAGSYTIHAYLTYANGQKVGIDLGKRKFSLSKPQLSLTQSGLQMVSRLKPAKEDQLLSAVWSDEGGQDDLKWYKADELGNILAAYTNHRGYGTYHVHTYLKKNGKMLAIGNQEFQISKPTFSHQIKKLRDTSYEVVISHVPSYITSLTAAIWSQEKGQDDIQWYQPQRVADGVFRLQVHLKEHHFDLGSYQLHIYGQGPLQENHLEGISATDFHVDPIKTYEDPQITIGHYDMTKGTFQINVAETIDSKFIQSISVAVWSEVDQTNLYWYETKRLSDGKLSVTADIHKHGNKSGLYNVHAYVHYNDGSSSGHILASQQLEQIISQQAPAPRVTAYINEKNTYPVGQCTWGVKELAPWAPNWLGNGGQWAANARAKGFKTGFTPKIGAIACWDDGGYGHVAYVIDVQSHNRIQVKEANYKNQQFIANFRGWFDPTAPYWGRLTYIYPD